MSVIVTGHEGSVSFADHTACLFQWSASISTRLYVTDNFGDAWSSFLPGAQGLSGTISGRLFDDEDPGLTFDQYANDGPSAVVLTVKNQNLSFDAYVSDIVVNIDRYNTQNQTFSANFVSTGEVTSSWNN